MPTSRPIIVWFRQDLRVHDHYPLTAAAADAGAIAPVFILDEYADPSLRPGGASRWWLHHSLASLQQAIHDRGGRLLLRRGATLAALQSLAEESGAAGLYFERAIEPAARDLQEAVERELGGTLTVRTFPANLLQSPLALRTAAGQPFRVFTPFWKSCRLAAPPALPLPAPVRLDTGRALASDPLSDWGLLPSAPDWAVGLKARWQPGEEDGLARLDEFLDGPVSRYALARDRPDAPGTSRLSPHLHFGELSARQVWHAVQLRAVSQGDGEAGAESYLRELGWREFAAHLLHAWPDLAERPFRPEFEAFPWREDAGGLAAWQRGETGYPMVDAGMRELWNTGWMHNRARMIVASFLVKHLLIHWRQGAAWFMDTLVDADLANNTAGWQWVAGCGVDAAPYFRIFNPVLQGEKFDPLGHYVRRWIPELRDLPDEYIHAPWKAPPPVLRASRIALGTTYPGPIVDHAHARAAALAAFRQIRATHG